VFSTKLTLMAGLLAGAAALPALAAAPMRFDVTAIGVFNPSSINNLGQVSGWITSAGSPSAALYDGSRLNSLGAPPGGSYAYGLNDAGVVVGAYRDSHAFRYAQNRFNSIGATGGTAYAVNNASQIVGAMDVAGSRHAFLYAGNKLVDLSAGQANGGGSIAYGVTESGQVVGARWDSEFAEWHAFIYANGVTTDLSGAVPGFSRALAANDHGQVIGNVDNGGPGNRATYLYANGVATHLGDLGLTETSAADINSAGFVVGTGANLDAAYGTGGFIWHNGAMQELSALIDPASGWTITRAMGINDNNQIAAFGCQIGGGCQALLLNLRAQAVPEPSTWAMLAGGLGLIGHALRRRRRAAP
jgi:probable HAF family extracellular repeat protein